jgi:hypothetical protein
MSKKIIYYFAVFISTYICIFILAISIRGAHVFGFGHIVKTIFRPLELATRNAKKIINEGVNDNGHLYPKTKIVNKFVEDFYILNTVKNNNEDQVEIRNLRTNKNVFEFNIPKEFQKNYDNRLRYNACINKSNDKIAVSATETGSIGLFDLHTKRWKWIIHSDSIILHHRIKFEGDNIICNIRKLGVINNTNLRNEGFGIIDGRTGKMIQKWWIIDHYQDLGNIYFFKGSALNAGELDVENNADFWHINDVEVVHVPVNGILHDGDILMSLRNLNTIIQIREGKIYNYFTGNFLHQHDVDVVNNHTITIFNNNDFTFNYPWMNEYKTNIIFKDLITGRDSIVHDNIGLNSISEGQYENLNRFEYIENQNQNEIIILKNHRIIYRGGISNITDPSKVNLLNWCTPIVDLFPKNRTVLN